MSQLAESKGLILSSRNYKEKDKLVKIFTESSGKMMFYIKGIHRQNQPLSPALLPFTEAVYIGNFRSEGLSFLSSVKDVHAFRHIQEDIFLSGYGTYLLNLVDAAIEDHQYDPHLYSLRNKHCDGWTKEMMQKSSRIFLKSKYCNASELHQSGHTASYAGKQKENLTILPNMVV